MSEPDAKTTWWVPISYTKESRIDFSTTTPQVWLKNTAELQLPETLTAEEWYILNIQETGTDLNINTS
jgi:hypothetical protein